MASPTGAADAKRSVPADAARLSPRYGAATAAGEAKEGSEISSSSKSRSASPVFSTVNVSSRVSPMGTVTSNDSGSTPAVGAGKPSPTTATSALGRFSALLSTVSVPTRSPVVVGVKSTAMVAVSPKPSESVLVDTGVKSSESETTSSTASRSPPSFVTSNERVAVAPTNCGSYSRT